MFSRQGGLSNNSSGSSSNLVEFRAGRMNMVGKVVHPDTRKGLVYLTQGDDGLMHFCWKDRTTGKVEDDLIVFPDDFEFKRVDQCKTGRVYVLKYKTSSRRMFFWMQEPKTDKDEEYCRRVNELMNNPPSSQRNASDSGDLQYMLNNMSQQQLMQLFGGVGQMGGLSTLLGSMNRTDSTSRSSVTATSSRIGGSSNALITPENSPASAPRTPSAPKNKGTKNNSSNNSGTANTSRAVTVDLSAAISSSEAINQLLADPEFTEALSAHLPELEDSDENKKKQIKDTIRSPQFQQALSLFSKALQSAQLGPVISQFKLTPAAVAAAYSGNLEDFIRALDKALPEGTSIAAMKSKESGDNEDDENKQRDSDVDPESKGKKE